MRGDAARGRQLHLHPPGRGARPRATRCCARSRWSATSRSRCILADDLIDAEAAGDEADGARSSRSEGARCSACRRCRASRRGSYGIVDASTRCDGDIARMHRHRREAASPADAPSTLAVVGRYVLTPRDLRPPARRCAPGAGGEIQLTDGIAALLTTSSVLAYAFEGRRYDCGSQARLPAGDRRFTALKHPEIGEEFRALPRNRAKIAA